MSEINAARHAASEIADVSLPEPQAAYLGAALFYRPMMEIPRHNAGQDPGSSDQPHRAPSEDPASTPIHTQALALIEQLTFRLAVYAGKTMPQPHEYTVRDKTDATREAAFVLLFFIIQADGVIERWQRRTNRYLYPGDGYKYWAMTTLEPQSRILNRMRVEDDLERLRQE